MEEDAVFNRKSITEEVLRRIREGDEGEGKFLLQNSTNDEILEKLVIIRMMKSHRLDTRQQKQEKRQILWGNSHSVECIL